MIIRAFLLLLVLFATGCATQRGVAPSPAAGEGGVPAQAVAPPPDSPEAFAALAARDAQLRDAAGWALTGRLAVARGNDGGTLNVQWVQTGASFDIRLSAPVTGRQWRLFGSAEGAILEGREGGPREGPDPEALLLEATGWRLPIRQMPDWVRGLRGPGPVAGLSVDAEGRPVGFRQDAWTLSYRDWWPGDPPLPRRVFAKAEGASVRLVVSEWKARPE
jgi:outer membrane lipoprotein LolB